MTKNSVPAPIRVLLIDDDDNAYPLIVHLLGKVPGKKFKVDWAANYQAGLDVIANQQHDVYLVDYRLGAKTGLDLVRRALALGAQAPFIMLTGADDPKVDFEATKVGAADFLLKDKLDTSSLERSIRYAMQHAETLNALKKSNERFRLLFERSRDALLFSDDKGSLLEVNTAACQLLGYSREELLDMTLSDLLLTEFNEFNEANEQFTGELTFMQRDGECRHAEFSACRFGPNLNLSILRDITERRNLEAQIQEISENEQRRIGQDLHDDLGQALTGISFLAKVLQQRLAARGVSEAVDAGTIVTLLNDALSHTKQLARGLCPVVLESRDIQTALQQLAGNIEGLFGVSARVECSHSIELQDKAVATHLYRIAQEATTNAIKHGKAQDILLKVTQHNGVISLQIQDDGIGFSRRKSKSKGMGLRVMQYRARIIGGTLEIERGPKGGMVVKCSLEKKAALTRASDLVSRPLVAERPARARQALKAAGRTTHDNS